MHTIKKIFTLIILLIDPTIVQAVGAPPKDFGDLNDGFGSLMKHNNDEFPLLSLRDSGDSDDSKNIQKSPLPMDEIGNIIYAKGKIMDQSGNHNTTDMFLSLWTQRMQEALVNHERRESEKKELEQIIARKANEELTAKNREPSNKINDIVIDISKSKTISPEVAQKEKIEKIDKDTLNEPAIVGNGKSDNRQISTNSTNQSNTKYYLFGSSFLASLLLKNMIARDNTKNNKKKKEE